MKAAVLKGVRSVAIEERPTPKVRARDDVLVRIRASGICGSDLHGFQGLSPDKRALGLIMGHENAGEVAEVAEDVMRFKAKDRVTVNPMVACTECNECRKGWFNACSNMKHLGSSARGACDGGFAEYVVVPERNLHPLPENLSFEKGAMIDAVANAVHLLNRAQIEIGDAIAIFGAGTLGLSLAQMARIAGAGDVFIVDVCRYRLKTAESLGAHFCINARRHDPVEFILTKTQGRGVDIAIEAVGIKDTYRQCVLSVRKKGKVMALGNTADYVDVKLFRFVSWELSMLGCTGFLPHEIDRSLELIAQEKIKVEPLITHRFSLDEAQKAFEILDGGGEEAIKIILTP